MRGLIFLILVSSNNIFSILEIEILKGSDNLSKIAFIHFGIEKNIDEMMLLKRIKDKISIHPSNFLIKKINKFPINKNFKISYNHKIFG